MTQSEAETIARMSFRNRSLIAAAAQCGCFYCQAVFPSDEIREWTDDAQTALCPRCGVDAVLADVSDRDALRELHHYRFEEIVPIEEVLKRFAAADGKAG